MGSRRRHSRARPAAGLGHRGLSCSAWQFVDHGEVVGVITDLQGNRPSRKLAGSPLATRQLRREGGVNAPADAAPSANSSFSV